MFNYRITANVNVRENGSVLIEPFDADTTMQFPEELPNRDKAMKGLMLLTAFRIAETLKTTVSELCNRDIDIKFKDVEVVMVH